MTAYTTMPTASVGELLLVADATGLTGVYFAGKKHAPVIDPAWVHDPTNPTLRCAAEQIGEYFNGKRQEFSVEMAFAGTPFQRKVWEQIARIPFGRTITYTELAGRAGSGGAVRAAGAATGRNPISILIPCHRVVGKNGAITGYAGGLDRKKHLLALEGVGV